ncbi:hypothetical protein [Maribacter ulvicola]|uniref:Uncharacterized protein n=1 Tax=Maribacter ulvicola TaxID=228959 RepID=A0A1N6TXC0_9FLAO|nr:hypothetical protein [Maribacter ulvicola]SIQ57901.1 hypothetical protein SAMN05421797_102120 [Maribacter ulvicola]
MLLQVLTNRIDREESILFAAYEDNKAIALIQLHYTFSFISLQKSLFLKDLFVKTDDNGDSTRIRYC